MAFDTSLSFLNNPLVGAIGSAMTAADPQGPVASIAAALPPELLPGMAASTPTTTQAAPPPPPNTNLQAAHSNVQGTVANREFRQHAPEARATSATRGLGPGGAGQAGMGLPGVMSPDVLMHPEVQKLLGQYGITPQQLQGVATGASPNLFITNPAAYEKHPVLSGMVERGLEGLAFTQGGRTVGESISNVARGMLDAKAARAEKYNNQLMMPFAQAQQVANLQGTSIDQNYKAAEAKRADAMSDYYGKLGDVREQLADIQKQRADVLATFHKHETNFHLQNMMSKIPFNADENARYGELLKEAGGDEQEIDPGALNTLLSTASQRKIDEDNKAKMARTQVTASGAMARKNTPTPVDHSYDMAKTEYDKAVAAEAKATSDAKTRMIIDPDTNKTVVGNNVGTVLAKYHARTVASQKKMEDAVQTRQGMSVPGSGMTSTQHIKAYDPKTGTIH